MLESDVCMCMCMSVVLEDLPVIMTAGKIWQQSNLASRLREVPEKKQLVDSRLRSKHIQRSVVSRNNSSKKIAAQLENMRKGDESFGLSRLPFRKALRLIYR